MQNEEKKTAIEQARIAGKWKPGVSGNPSGAGGFADNPQNINPRGRPKNRESFTYWMHEFKNMTVDQFRNWPVDNPESTRTIAAELAYQRVFSARVDLAEFREVADRTEGRSPQTIKHQGEIETGAKEVANILRSIIESDDDSKD